MDKQKSTSSTSRFNEGTIANRQQTAARPASRPADNVRRPSGFGTAGQTRKVTPAPEPETKKAIKIKSEKPAKAVYLLPEKTPVPFSYEDGRIVFTVKEMDLFDMYQVEL
jgi:hypothetical protein